MSEYGEPDLWLPKNTFTKGFPSKLPPKAPWEWGPCLHFFEVRAYSDMSDWECEGSIPIFLDRASLHHSFHRLYLWGHESIEGELWQDGLVVSVRKGSKSIASKSMASIIAARHASWMHAGRSGRENPVVHFSMFLYPLCYMIRNLWLK